MNNSTINTQVYDLLLELKSLITSQNRKWLRSNEAAEYLGISITQLHHLKRNGTLPFSKVAGSIYFKIADIDQLLEDNLVEVGQ